MNFINLKQMSIKFILNYRIIFAYLMALSYLCMHYFVSNTQYIEHNNNNDIPNVVIIILSCKITQYLKLYAILLNINSFIYKF